MPELVVDHVGKQFPTRGEPLVVLRDVSLSMSTTDSVAILGPSGSGKSTLLNLIGTLEAPTSGSITLHGENPFVLSESELARFRRRNIGFVFQEHHLIPQLSILENVVMPALAEGKPSRGTVDRARELIDRVGLTARTDHRPAELSGGERQRVAVARALLMRPAILLADEPTGSLDRTTALRVAELLFELQRQEQTMMIAVTHSPELAGRFSRQLEFDDGRLVERNAAP